MHIEYVALSLGMLACVGLAWLAGRVTFTAPAPPPAPARTRLPDAPPITRAITLPTWEEDPHGR
jgi:hypothetical protein